MSCCICELITNIGRNGDCRELHSVDVGVQFAARLQRRIGRGPVRQRHVPSQRIRLRRQFPLHPLRLALRRKRRLYRRIRRERLRFSSNFIVIIFIIDIIIIIIITIIVIRYICVIELLLLQIMIRYLYTIELVILIRNNNYH